MNISIKMMTKALLTFIVIFKLTFCIKCFGQDHPANDTLINKYILELQKKGVDTKCTYQAYFPGAIRFPMLLKDTSCLYSNNADIYFLWKTNGVTYITLKNWCADYNIVSVHGDQLWDFYTDNKIKMNIEKIREFEMVTVKSRKRDTIPIEADHSPRQDVTLIIGKMCVKHHFDGFAFEKLDDKMININYQHNLNAKTTKFKAILENIIKRVVEKELLKKTIQ